MVLEVIAQLELRIVLQGRVRQVERCEDQALPVTRQQMDAAREMLDQPIKVDLALEGLKDTDVERPVGRLVVQEGGVLGAQATRRFACLSHF